MKGTIMETTIDFEKMKDRKKVIEDGVDAVRDIVYGYDNTLFDEISVNGEVSEEKIEEIVDYLLDFEYDNWVEPEENAYRGILIDLLRKKPEISILQLFKAANKEINDWCEREADGCKGKCTKESYGFEFADRYLEEKNLSSVTLDESLGYVRYQLNRMPRLMNRQLDRILPDQPEDKIVKEGDVSRSEIPDVIMEEIDGRVLRELLEDGQGSIEIKKVKNLIDELLKAFEKYCGEQKPEKQQMQLYEDFLYCVLLGPVVTKADFSSVDKYVSDDDEGDPKTFLLWNIPKISDWTEILGAVERLHRCKAMVEMVFSEIAGNHDYDVWSNPCLTWESEYQSFFSLMSLICYYLSDQKDRTYLPDYEGMKGLPENEQLRWKELYESCVSNGRDKYLPKETGRIYDPELFRWIEAGDSEIVEKMQLEIRTMTEKDAIDRWGEDGFQIKEDEPLWSSEEERGDFVKEKIANWSGGMNDEVKKTFIKAYHRFRLHYFSEKIDRDRMKDDMVGMLYEYLAGNK
ncbi:MAG: hypothetical protein K6A72_09025 [Lachnospiraceae bacterium]|nr:hypothetical protein [Lachnospiraceae bacterium]